MALISTMMLLLPWVINALNLTGSSEHTVPGPSLPDEECFIAAVFERSPPSNKDKLTLAERIDLGYEDYRRAAQLVSRQGADIIVFPEYGIIDSVNRSEPEAYLDDLMDPKESDIIPCDQPYLFINESIVVKMSCLAKENGIYVMFNTIDKKMCKIGDVQCPRGGYRYNTNIAFDRRGKFVARYHKAHPFLEFMIDAAPLQEPVYFDTDFGRIGTFICFDLMFRESVDLVEKYHIDTIAFTTWWREEVPFLAATQMQQAWAIVNNVNFIGTNIHNPSDAAFGSSISSGRYGALTSTHEVDKKHHLLMAKLPKKPRLQGQCKQTKFEVDFESVAHHKMIPAISGSAMPYLYGSANLSDYKMKKLLPEGHYDEECHKGVCCKVNYSLSEKGEKDDVYLVVHNGTKSALHLHSWCEEVCAVVRCKSRRRNPCAVIKPESNTIFRYLNLEGTFSTKYVYPSIVGPLMKLYFKTQFDFNRDDETGRISLNTNNIQEPIVAAVLYGRCYDRDTPYKRIIPKKRPILRPSCC